MVDHLRHNFYTCPMHPNIRQDKPGLCPKCGMSLIQMKLKGGIEVRAPSEDKHAGHDVNIFARKFWVSLILTVPILAYSELPERFFGWTSPQLSVINYQLSVVVPLILGSIIFFYGGLIFLQGAFRELRARLPGMMTLIALAITIAYVYSIVVTFIPGYHTLFWELATLITIMLLGHWMEMRAVQGAQGALRELSKLLPDTAELIVRNDQFPISNFQSSPNFQIQNTKTIQISELKVEDVVLIRPGGKIPADGIVVEGAAEVNESMITGESAPVSKYLGSKVIAGTVSGGDGSLKVEITEMGEKTFLAGVMRLVAEAQASKSRLQLLSDRAAYYLTIIAIVSGAATFGAWTYVGSDMAFAMARVVAVLVIACPHALGLAIPLVASISTSLAATNGFLVKKRSALELARDVDTVIFDKTGTLTKGEFGVESVIINENAALKIDEDELLQMVASVDANSEHFVSMAIVKKAKEKDIGLLETKDFKRLSGRGVFGVVNGFEVTAGGEALLVDRHFSLSEEFINRKSELAAKGKTIIYAIMGQELTGAIILGDIIREESMEAVKDLKKMDKKIVMLTGDSEEVARWVSEELGIDEYYAKVMPGEKVEIVRQLQNPKFKTLNSKQILNSNNKNSKQFRISSLGFRVSTNRRFVAMVGDGINDAPALTQADLGIAIGAGTNVAIESAGIILVKNDPRDVVKIINLSKATYSKMLQNLFWATGYNIVALPLAAGVLISRGILLQPALAALFMSLSTVIVAVNALLLKRKKL